MTHQRRSILQWLSLNRLVVLITFIAIFIMAIRYPADSDSWWHLLAGKTMLAQKTWLFTDIFSHTQAGAAWINHGWLAQLFWYSLMALGGLPALSLGLAVIVTLAFAIVWFTAEGNLYARAFGLILGAIASSIIWTARPQLISLLFTAVAALLLHRFKRKEGKLLPWYPLLVLLWVNVHGGFAIAFILLICYALGEAFNIITGRNNTAIEKLSRSNWNHLFWTSFISLAVVAINPNTWRMWLYPFQTVGIGVLRDFIAEWQSPNFHEPILYPFLLMILLLLTAFARNGNKVDWTDLALVGAWLTLSLFAVRNVAVFAIVCTPALIRYSTLALEAHFGPLKLGQARPLPKMFYTLNWLLLGLIILGAMGQMRAVLSPTQLAKKEAEMFPVEAVHFIQQNQPPGPMFNSYNIGGYLMYHLWPEYPVFVDGRTDLYDDDFLRDYLKTANGLSGWEETLEAYQIELLVLENNVLLSDRLEETSGWDKIFSDDQNSVFLNLK